MIAQDIGDLELTKEDVCDKLITLQTSWGISSVGRAPALQAGGHEFESRILHLVSRIDIIYMYLENRIQEI